MEQPFVVLGKTLLGKRAVSKALHGIYGIGDKQARVLCSKFGINPYSRVSTLPPSVAGRITKELQMNWNVEEKLRRELSENLNRLVGLDCYRGRRHASSLPARGQRTKTNAKTQRREGRKRPVKRSFGAKSSAGGKKGWAARK